MTATNTDALSKAIASLGAVEVAPGRYAFNYRGAWFTAGLRGVREVAFCQVNRYGDTPKVIRDFCKAMPSSWKPGDPMPEDESHA